MIDGATDDTFDLASLLMDMLYDVHGSDTVDDGEPMENMRGGGHFFDATFRGRRIIVCVTDVGRVDGGNLEEVEDDT